MTHVYAFAINHYALFLNSNPYSMNLDSWWCHQMETFSALLALFAGNSLVTGEFPSQRPVTWSIDVFFDRCLNKCLSKQSLGWWFEMLSHSLCCNCNVYSIISGPIDIIMNSISNCKDSWMAIWGLFSIWDVHIMAWYRFSTKPFPQQQQIIDGLLMQRTSSY